MALEIFRAISNLRMVLDTETDYDSPDAEVSRKATREMIEILFQLMLDTGVSGTATSDPSNDANGYFYDTNESWTDDEHNGRTLLICSGNAKGNFYTIDDTDDANARLDCTGDNLYSDGVRSGDDYKILYDIKVNTSGHNHDGVNSSGATVADAQITQAKLKTSTQSQSYDIAAETTHKFTLTGGQYCFKATIKGEDTYIKQYLPYSATASYTVFIALRNDHISNERYGYVLHRYVTSSGEVYWIFIMRDKLTKEIIGVNACDDHPSFGYDGDCERFPHPFGDAYDPDEHEIIVINPTKEEVIKLKKKTSYNKCLAQVISEDCEVDETTKPDWPSIPVTVGLPPDWEELPIGSMIEPIKKVIPKPVYIKTAGLKIKKIEGAAL